MSTDLPTPVADARFAARFRGYVRSGPLDACWPWLGCRTSDGYGIFTWPDADRPGARRKYRAHRVALTLKVGPPPAGAPLALHHCNQPACCNPKHLYWGTAADNIADRDRPQRRTQLRLQRLARSGQHPLHFDHL